MMQGKKLLHRHQSIQLGLKNFSGPRCLSTVVTTAPATINIAGVGDVPVHPEFFKRRLPVTIKHEHYVPKAERSVRKPFNVDYQFGEERLMRSDRSDPTRELNFTPLHWKKHKSPYRKWRYMLNTIRSSPFQRLLFPDLFISASVSALVTYLNLDPTALAAMGAFTPGAQLTVSIAGFTGVTTAIGLLAGFRLNSSYKRYEECRIFWGGTINTTRDLAGNTMMWMKDPDQRDRMLKLIRSFPVCYNFHVNRKGGHHNMFTVEAGKPKFEDRIQAEFQAELLDIYADGKQDDDLRRLSEVKYKGGNIGLECLTLMRETIAGSVGTVEGIYVRECDEQVQVLCGVFGASERVLRTPLPTSFTRHTSRLLFLWDCLLPFAMYPIMGPYMTLPACLLTSYAVLGIEDVGVQMEEPFDILPLRQYSDGIFDSVNQIERNFKAYEIGYKAKQAGYSPISAIEKLDGEPTKALVGYSPISAMEKLEAGATKVSVGYSPITAGEKL